MQYTSVIINKDGEVALFWNFENPLDTSGEIVFQGDTGKNSKLGIFGEAFRNLFVETQSF